MPHFDINYIISNVVLLYLIKTNYCWVPISSTNCNLWQLSFRQKYSPAKSDPPWINQRYNFLLTIFLFFYHFPPHSCFFYQWTPVSVRRVVLPHIWHCGSRDCWCKRASSWSLLASSLLSCPPAPSCCFPLRWGSWEWARHFIMFGLNILIFFQINLNYLAWRGNSPGTASHSAESLVGCGNY